jgi:hypothetical protein
MAKVDVLNKLLFEEGEHPNDVSEPPWTKDVEEFKLNHPNIDLADATEKARADAELDGEDMADWPGIEDTMRTQGFRIRMGDDEDSLAIETPYGTYYFDADGKYTRTVI